jgi:phosphoribosylanthranilate isomerase
LKKNILEIERTLKTQIYTMQSVEEAHEVIAQGVDHIGLTPSNRGLPGEIDLITAREIVNAVKDTAVCVALTVESELEEIVNMVQVVQPDILHLCGLENSLLPDAVASLKNLLPDMPIMQAISVAGPEAVDTALAYQDVSDYLILDTQAPDIEGIGASGKIHDWNVSREIVHSVNIPVILAGGLSPDNVAEAIKHVQPWGVDSLTHTNYFHPDGSFNKDIDLVGQFVKAAK